MLADVDVALPVRQRMDAHAAALAGYVMPMIEQIAPPIRPHDRWIRRPWSCHDDPVSTCVDRGHGVRSFCASWDLQAGARLAAEQGAAAKALMAEDFDPADAHARAPMGPSRLRLSKPVIAAVAGAAVAGGMELALWCDLQVMEADAYFGVYCRRFGVPLIDGGTVRLPRLIGMGYAMDLILTGRQVGAEEALRMGLANRVVQPGPSRDAALALARELAAFPQATMRADRESAYKQWDLPLGEALHQE